MELLARNFCAAYPDVTPIIFKGQCKVEEPKNKKSGTGFLQIEFKGIDGVSFPHELANKASSFASKVNHTGILLQDCDGIVLFEKDGQKYMLFCELKSTFSTEEIAKAKNQLVGSYIKMKGILSTLQGYDNNTYKPIGVIVSFEPTQEQLNAISKRDDRHSHFAISLNTKKIYCMHSSKCNSFFHPFAVGDFDIYYVGVPNRQQIYSVDLYNIIK